MDPLIVAKILEHLDLYGEISMAEVCSRWHLDKATYKALCKQLVCPRIRMGKQGPGGGGFRRVGPSSQTAHLRRSATPTTTPTAKAITRVLDAAVDTPPAHADPMLNDWEHSWQDETVKRLSTLPYETLEGLLGELKATIHQARGRWFSGSPRGTKSDIAAALVLIHDIDLFADPDIRRAVARAFEVHSPKHWCPGKLKALEFVDGTKFPRALAGITPADDRPDWEFIEPRYAPRKLKEFQQEVKDLLLEALGTPSCRRMVTLPTGAGKTRVAVEAIRDWLTSLPSRGNEPRRHHVVLWVAHSEELCEQAYLCFKQIWQARQDACKLGLFRFWGDFSSNPAAKIDLVDQISRSANVLVATTGRLDSLINGKPRHAVLILEALRDSVGLIVFDEAHRAAAPSYRAIRDAFECELGRREAPPHVLGLTATPFRHRAHASDPFTGTRELKELFETIVQAKSLGADPYKQLQDDRVLACLKFEWIKTEVLLHAPQTSSSEEDTAGESKLMEEAAYSQKRRFAVLDGILKHAQNPENSILYFGPTVSDARSMAYLLRAKGILARVLSATTKDATRLAIIRDFKEKRFRVLCNCEVLTTGFDAPCVTHVVVARPTFSLVLYMQMIGRGMRGHEFGGTDECVIVNCEDQWLDLGEGQVPPAYDQFMKVWDLRRSDETKR